MNLQSRVTKMMKYISRPFEQIVSNHILFSSGTTDSERQLQVSLTSHSMLKYGDYHASASSLANNFTTLLTLRPRSAVLDTPAREPAPIFRNSLPLWQIGASAQGRQGGQQLRLTQAHGLGQSRADEDGLEGRGGLRLDILRKEAAEGGWIRQRRGVEGPPGDVAEVDAGEGVDTVGVAADFACGWVGSTLGGDGSEDIWEGPCVVESSAVPVVGNAFVPVFVLEGTLFITSV